MSDTHSPAEKPTDAQSDDSTQIIMGEVFIEPQGGHVTVDTRDAERLVKLEIGTNGRGASTQIVMDADSAHVVADRLATTAEEVADNE